MKKDFRNTSFVILNKKYGILILKYQEQENKIQLVSYQIFKVISINCYKLTLNTEHRKFTDICLQKHINFLASVRNTSCTKALMNDWI